MKIFISQTKQDLGRAAAEKAAECIKAAIAERGEANIIVATGASQFEMLEHLVKADLDWSVVTGFHLDEYVGMPITHDASFRRYLKERFVDKVDGLNAFHYVEGDAADSQEACDALGEIITKHPIDVACVGIGENGHLAFNDPPADFDTEAAYLVVELDELCRKQQMGEGWFPTLADVPTCAISMGIKQIMKSKCIVTSVPDERKATAVANCLEGEVTNMHPASILQQHDDCHIYLDVHSASQLTAQVGD